MPAKRHAFGRELSASIVVFLVALPLSMGIALASGAPIVSGLIAAAVGGVVVGLLAGAPLQVSGPAAGLAVIVYGFVEQFGWAQLGIIVVGAGLLQVVLGAARIARLAMAISPAVIHGMLAGIGVQIALAQMHVLLGGAPQASAVRNVAELPAQVLSLHGASAGLGLATVALLVLWPRLPFRVAKAFPGALVAVVATTLASSAFGLEVARVELPDDLGAALTRPVWPPAGRVGEAVFAAATLAFVASAESLLCAVATDKLHEGRRANLDRELMAQGVGNVCSGMLGGLPITGVIVRSTANITAGARTRWSAVLHGVWVVLFVTTLGWLLMLIPLAALAGLLVFVGAKLVDPRPVREFLRHREASTYFVTLAGVVLVDLLTGIGLGIVWAVVHLLRRRTRVAIAIAHSEDRTHVVVRGALTFVGVPKLTASLASIPPGRDVDVDLEVEMMDHAGFEALHAFRSTYERTGGHVDVDLRHERWVPNVGQRAPVAEPA